MRLRDSALTDEFLRKVGHPPEDIEAVFEEAGRHGFRKVARVGEEGTPEYIRK